MLLSNASLGHATGDGQKSVIFSSCQLSSINMEIQCEMCDTISDLSDLESICHEYMARNRPLLIKGAAKGWDACKKWTFEYFMEDKVGSTLVDVSLDPKEAGKKQRQSIRDYIASIRALPVDDERKESIIQKDDDSGHHTNFVPYLRAWHFPEEQGQLLHDFPNPPPYFPDKFKKLDQNFQPPFTWIFIGPEGAYSPLHRDIWFTCAWMAQIQGKKRFLFFPPSDLKHVYRKVMLGFFKQRV